MQEQEKDVKDVKTTATVPISRLSGEVKEGERDQRANEEKSESEVESTVCTNYSSI